MFETIAHAQTLVKHPDKHGFMRDIAFANGYRSVRLLVVEDDKDLNRQIAAALTQASYAVDRAFDGEEGWFLGDTEPYDAVVLDLGLPKKDGTSVLSEWRWAGRAMPVLILTARDRWSDKVQGFDAGADDYVAKPFHIEEILARLARCYGAPPATPRANLGSVQWTSIHAWAGCRSMAIRSSLPRTNTGCCLI